MDWNARYAVSRALTLGFASDGSLLATNSVSRPPRELAFDALPVLRSFAAGETPRAILARLSAERESEVAASRPIDADGFAATVRELIAHNYLTPVAVEDGAAPALVTEGFAAALHHHHMLRDTVRMAAYRDAIDRHCQGRSVVEIGCGTGILSIFAARAGARRVVAIEESAIADVAARLFAANGCEGVIELRRGSSRDVELDEPADLVLHELFGNDPLGENVLPTLADAKHRLLAPRGRFLPGRLEVACVGLDTRELAFHDRPRVLAEALGIKSRYGLDLGPWLDLLSQLEARWFKAPSGWDGGERIGSATLTGECPLLDLDFAAGGLDSPAPLPAPCLRAEKSGLLGALLVYFRAHFDEATVLSTAPSAPRTHWSRDVRLLSRPVAVEPGDELPLAVAIERGVGRERLAVDLA